MTVVTFGHGTASEEEIIDLLRGARIGVVVDVRTAPGSRRNPWVAKSALQRWLPDNGIGYRWDGRLGGFRKMPTDSADTAWSNDAFRAYAAHMRTSEFLDGMGDLLSESDEKTTVAVMCSESVWWRCHRRLIADFLQLSRNIAVRHLMHDGALREHAPISGVRLRADGLLVYDGGQDSLL